MDEASDQSDCRLKKNADLKVFCLIGHKVMVKRSMEEATPSKKYSLLKSDHKKHRLGKRSTACTFHTEGQVMTHW